MSDASSTLDPTPVQEREPILDVLRGFALLGILLVNVELMRGSQYYDTLLGSTVPAPDSVADRVASFLVGWLATGKFVSSFSIMFGIGTALITGRALAAGHSPVRLLARRYGWLIGIGLAHMLLLFPGDVLFVYGITGLVLLVFLPASPRTALRWSVGLLAAMTLVAVIAVGLGELTSSVAEGTGTDPLFRAVEPRQDLAAAAFADGSYGSIVRANAWLSLLIQSGQLFLLPWFLGLFLFGFVLGRSDLVHGLRQRRALLRRGATVGLAIGLPVNLVLGLLGPLGAGTEATPGWLLPVGMAVQLLGAPLLAVGYLSALTLFCLRWGVVRPLAAAGRMALSAYLLQSALGLLVFAGFGYYDQLGSARALLVVVAIWAVVLAVSVIWMRMFRYGPAEWLWRSLTYGQRQPMRILP